jgi:hypothetical protein
VLITTGRVEVTGPPVQTGGDVHAASQLALPLPRRMSSPSALGPPRDWKPGKGSSMRRVMRWPRMDTMRFGRRSSSGIGRGLSRARGDKSPARARQHIDRPADVRVGGGGLGASPRANSVHANSRATQNPR